MSKLEALARAAYETPLVTRPRVLKWEQLDPEAREYWADVAKRVLDQLEREAIYKLELAKESAEAASAERDCSDGELRDNEREYMAADAAVEMIIELFAELGADHQEIKGT